MRKTGGWGCELVGGTLEVQALLSAHLNQFLMQLNTSVQEENDREALGNIRCSASILEDTLKSFLNYLETTPPNTLTETLVQDAKKSLTLILNPGSAIDNAGRFNFEEYLTSIFPNTSRHGLCTIKIFYFHDASLSTVRCIAGEAPSTTQKLKSFIVSANHAELQQLLQGEESEEALSLIRSMENPSAFEYAWRAVESNYPNAIECIHLLIAHGAPIDVSWIQEQTLTPKTSQVVKALLKSGRIDPANDLLLLRSILQGENGWKFTLLLLHAGANPHQMVTSMTGSLGFHFDSKVCRELTDPSAVEAVERLREIDGKQTILEAAKILPTAICTLLSSTSDKKPNPEDDMFIDQQNAEVARIIDRITTMPAKQ